VHCVGGEYMSQWGYVYESPSPCGFTGAGYLSPFGWVKGHTRGCSRDCEYMKTPRPGHEC